MTSLFGEDFDIVLKEKPVKDIIKKINSPASQNAEAEPEKLLKSKKISLQERLAIITNNVLCTLGKQKDNILVIKDIKTFETYIDNAILSGRIAIDTETNNSTDTVQGKLAGLCLYYPGGKQAYIPVNHRNPETKERLAWQLTEQDCQTQLKRLIDSKILKVFHNGKFDYEVLKTTCNIEVIPDWDTMIAAWLIDENKFGFSNSSLKSIYTTYIDKSQEKYSIDQLFKNISYLDVGPDIFAYYAATDALMTDKVYLWELPFYTDEANADLNWLYKNIDLPIIPVTAEIELTGVKIDTQLGEKLRQKYLKKQDAIDEKIAKILKQLKESVDLWRITPDAVKQAKTYAPKKTKMSLEKLEITYPQVDKAGRRFKIGKSKAEQLPEEINLSSPTQLAILFYDILNVSKAWSVQGDSDTRTEDEKFINDFERKIGKDELKKITDYLSKYLEDDQEEDEEDLEDEKEAAVSITANKSDHFKYRMGANLANLMLKRRNIAKLITTYFDVIPTLAQHWPDGRIRYKLNSAGTNTGRFSSGGKWHWLDENDLDIETSGINSQNIPSRGEAKITRLLFVADIKNHEASAIDNYYCIPETDEVETDRGWRAVQELAIGDVIIGKDNKETIKNIVKQDKLYYLYV